MERESDGKGAVFFFEEMGKRAMEDENHWC